MHEVEIGGKVEGWCNLPFTLAGRRVREGDPTSSFQIISKSPNHFQNFKGREMEKMNQAFEKVKMLVGMEVDEEDQASAALQQDSNFMDDFNRNCTLSTKQVINATS